MKTSVIRSDLRIPFLSGRSSCSGSIGSDSDGGPPSVSIRGGATTPPRLRAVENAGKQPICTADELHYVPVSNSDWELALWRYTPPPDAPRRNRPLLLLSGVGTNAIGYDLSPESSFARYMSGQGFDTWVLEVRGAGLSAEKMDPEKAVSFLSESEASLSRDKGAKTLYQDKLQYRPWPAEVPTNFFEIFSSFIGEGPYSIINLLRGLSKRILHLMEHQQSVPPPLIDFRECISSSLEDFERQLDVIVKYDWDFDHYLEEDVPAAIDYIRTHCKSKDYKLLAIGHSMGGILLYAMLSRYGSEGKDTGLASVATLGSSLDYTSSRSSLKLLLPLVDPAEALNVPVIPLGALLAAVHPFASRPPYILSWLNAQITAQDMMNPKLLEKLVMKNFGTVPAKLLLQLATAFREGGLCDRSGTFFYKDHICKTNVPILAIAGDRDLICPPEAVYETAKLIPEHLLTFKVFGEPDGPHYAHYDLVGGLMAADHVYPCIIDFLNRHDKV